jgi:hypothetical protein
LLPLIAGCLIAGWPAAVSAHQPYPNTAEFWGGVAGWSGEDARGFETGPSTGATFLFHIGMPVEVGLDIAFARMDSDQFVGEVDEFSASAEVRYRLAFIPVIRPFLGARGGYTRLSADYADLEFEQNGSMIGGNAGLEVPVGSRVMFVVTGEAMYYSYHDTTIFLEDIPIPSTGGSAWRYWGRLGLSFRWRH